MRAILLAGFILAGAGPALAEPARLAMGERASGPAASVVERWFTEGREISCLSRDEIDGPCGLDRVNQFRIFYDRPQNRAVVFVTWSPDSGNAASLAVAYFAQTETGWSFLRNLRTIYGQGPDGLDFEPGKAAFVMDAMMPDDGRCCPTGTQRYDVDLATGAVKEGPRLAKAGTQAPRPKAVPVALAAPPIAPRLVAEPSGRPWSHNGSTVFADPATGLIVYDAPKAAIRSVVRRGSVLFRGQLVHGKPVEGVAYAFKEGCPPAPYPVRGVYTDRDYTLTLRGAGPVRDGCTVTAYSTRSPHAVLKFSYLLDD